MPSQNKTPNYDLNQWQGTDYPLRSDFNDDNSKIDAALKALADGKLNLTGGTLTGDLKIKNVAPIVELEETDTGKKFFIVVDGSTISIIEDSLAGTSALNFDGQTKVLSTRGNKIWHEGNGGKDSGLDADLWRGWKVYNSPSELGLTSTTATVKQICDAMADKSIMVTTLNTNGVGLPTNGLWFLKIFKRQYNAVDLEAVGVAGSAYPNLCYKGTYNFDVGFTGWAEVARTDKGSITVDNTNWVSGTYGGGMAYRKTVPITGVTATDTVGFYPTLATKEIAQKANVSHLESYAGGVYLYAKSIPSGSITFDYRVIRG